MCSHATPLYFHLPTSSSIFPIPDICKSSVNPSPPPSPVYSATTRRPFKSNSTKRPASVTSTAKSADRNSKRASTIFRLPLTSTQTGSMRVKRSPKTPPKMRPRTRSSAVMLQVLVLQEEVSPLGAGAETRTRTKMPNTGMNDTFESISKEALYRDGWHSMAFTDEWLPVRLGTTTGPEKTKGRGGHITKHLFEIGP